MRVNAESADCVWACCQRLSNTVPYWFDTDAAKWRASFFDDVDGEGDALFSHLEAFAEMEAGEVVGFAQVGVTRYGFRDDGKDYAGRLGIIRTLWYAPKRTDVGIRLIREAAAYCEGYGVALGHAFFHYFGMSCYARHGKLHESMFYIEDALHACGMQKEHENVYFTRRLDEEPHAGPVDIGITGGQATPGGERAFVFLWDGERVGGCVVHTLPQGQAAYLRWIGIDSRFRHRGVGSRCMRALMHMLLAEGIRRLDTDTIDTNDVAQRVYQRMGFLRAGVTRSYAAALRVGK